MITPEQLAKPNTESAHQQALFCHFAIERHKHKRWLFTEWMHHIPNGGEREKSVAATLKAEGVKAGVWDIFLPVACRGYHGLYIEMKKPGRQLDENGGLSDAQIKFQAHLKATRYYNVVCYSWEDAVAVVEWYLAETEPKPGVGGL